MSSPFRFSEDYHEDFTELFLDAGQIELLDGEEGDSSFQALLEGSLRHTHYHDHLHVSMPLNAQTNACRTQPDQPFTPSPQPVFDEQIVNRLPQCIDHLQVTGDSVEGGVHVRKRRGRSPDWSDGEKRLYLLLKVEALGSVKGKDWNFISQNLEKRYGVRRSAKSCEDLWGTLRKAFKRIRGHASNDYWEMDADGRARDKLPRSFPKDSFTMMENILAAQEQRSRKNCKESQSSKTPANEDDDAWNSVHRRKRLEPDLHIKQYETNSALEFREEEDAVLKLLSRVVKSAVEHFTEASIEAELVEKLMMDAIHLFLVRPIVSDLREKGRLDELKDEARMKAIKNERRALDLEFQRRRQRVGRVPSKRLDKRNSDAEGTDIER